MDRTVVNRKARKEIAIICQRDNLTYCEAKLIGCMGQAHAPAHKYKRIWYYETNRTQLLWDKKHWIAACTSCHNKMEYNRGLTEIIFERCRG